MHVHVQAFRRPRLPLLGKGKIHVAQLHAAHLFESAEAYPPERWPHLPVFGPHVLVGYSADLQRLNERLELGTLRLESVDHSIFVVTALGDCPCPDALRTALWRRFGVPVFELYTDGNGALLAYECEAHAGWHVEPNSRFAVYEGELLLQRGASTAVRTGLSRQLESQMCVCGRPGVRIVANSCLRSVPVNEPLLAAIA